MIEIICGNIGGGKTLSCVKWGLDYVSNGGVWITNISLNLDACAYYLERVKKWKLQPGQIHQISGNMLELPKLLFKGRSDKHVLCTIDEASEWLDSYASPKSMMEIMSFFRQSRKVHIDLHLITQDIALIQRRVRLLAQYNWFMYDMSTFRFPLLRIKCPPPWNHNIVQVQFDRTGKNIVKKHWMFKDPLLYDCYTTTELFSNLGVKDANLDFEFHQPAPDYKLYTVFLAVSLFFSLFIIFYQ